MHFRAVSDADAIYLNKHEALEINSVIITPYCDVDNVICVREIVEQKRRDRETRDGYSSQFVKVSITKRKERKNSFKTQISLEQGALVSGQVYTARIEYSGTRAGR